MASSIGSLSIVLDGKYRLDDLLGEGAAGVVYRATHLGLKRVFALKLLKPGSALDAFSVSRFQREAEALGRLRHPHIVDVTDSGIDPGTGAPYLVMELRAGRASDLYSFGVIAYEMLAGRPPFEGTTREVLAGHLEREPPQGALSGPIWSVLRDCLAKDPDLRPATAREAVRRLRAAAGHERRARWLRAEAPRRALLAVLLAAAVAVTGLLLPTGLPAVERWAQDLRVRAAPAIPPDPRILLVTLDDGLIADRAEEIGGTL